LTDFDKLYDAVLEIVLNLNAIFIPLFAGQLFVAVLVLLLHQAEEV